MSRRIALFAVVCFFMFGCSHEPNGEHILELKKELQVNTKGQLPSNFDYRMMFFPEGIYENQKFAFHAIDSTRRYIERLTVSEEGGILLDSIKLNVSPAQIHEPTFCYPLKQGFLLGCPYSSQLLVLNEEGNLVNSITNFKDNPQHTTVLVTSVLDARYNLVPFSSAYSERPDSSYYRKDFGFLIDLEEEEGESIQPLKVKFPFNYLSGNSFGFPWFTTNWTHEGDICCNFKANDTLFIYHKDGRLLKQVDAGSEFNPVFEKETKDNTSPAYMRQYSIEEPAYERVIYDPYQQVYIRLLKHRCDYNMYEYKVPDSKDIAWSMILFDKDWNRIGEEYFPSSRGIVFPVFIVPSEKGIWISDFTYEEVREDGVLKFNLYKVNQ